MNRTLLAILLVVSFTGVNAQTHKTENVIVVTLDGLRWQEIFGGIDSALIVNTSYTKDSAALEQQFGGATAIERRKKLFPFLWNTIALNGQLYGNRIYDNKINVANPYHFSYPGYNEIFTGYPDTAVNSNDKILNKNVNVLEFINHQPAFKNKVAAFTTWDVFPYILNRQRSGLYINSDSDTITPTTPALKLLNELQYLAPRPIGVRPDVITYFAAKEYLKANRPKVLYISFDETDDLAHAGMYDLYLGSAHAEDAMIADLWNFIQQQPQYKNKTTLIITCDHGRGDKDKNNWRHHGADIEESSQIWLAAIGPDTKPLGELKTANQLYQKQIAATIASLLGLQFKAVHPVAAAIETIIR